MKDNAPRYFHVAGIAIMVIALLDIVSTILSLIYTGGFPYGFITVVVPIVLGGFVYRGSRIAATLSIGCLALYLALTGLLVFFIFAGGHGALPERGHFTGSERIAVVAVLTAIAAFIAFNIVMLGIAIYKSENSPKQ